MASTSSRSPVAAELMVRESKQTLDRVIFPISVVPPPYRGWLMYNPVAHGIEAARGAFASHYHVVAETSMPYFYGCALVILFFGLALHRRYASKMVTQ